MDNRWWTAKLIIAVIGIPISFPSKGSVSQSVSVRAEITDTENNGKSLCHRLGLNRY